jgi:hypothetical protein
MANTNQETQILLKSTWQLRELLGFPPPSFEDAQFSAFSQNGEDGILLLLFSLLGTTNRVCVELCAGDGIQCNTANLIVNHGWIGYLVDGKVENVREGNEFYSSNKNTTLCPPVFQDSWITRDNINDLVSDWKIDGEIDLLSLDMDGNDYWILEALSVISPRVIILEYQPAFGPDESVTQRYQENFVFNKVKVPGTLPRCGASLAALQKLAKRKGYRLVGC